MYAILSSISNFLSSPFIALLNHSQQIPLLASFLLGLVGALAPCQLTGNISAITYYGNKSLQSKKQWIETLYFIFGKIVVFSGLGLAVWLIGKEFQTAMTSFFAIFRQLVGPLIVFLGLFLLGIIKLNWVNRLFSRIPLLHRTGNWGSFLMGVSYSIAFCPTMFVLFFLTLMPIVLRSSYGMILPTIFAIGTSVPLLVMMFVIWYLGVNGALMKKSRQIGATVQKTAGTVTLLLGIVDTITYWQ